MKIQKENHIKEKMIAAIQFHRWLRNSFFDYHGGFDGSSSTKILENSKYPKTFSLLLCPIYNPLLLNVKEWEGKESQAFPFYRLECCYSLREISGFLLSYLPTYQYLSCSCLGRSLEATYLPNFLLRNNLLSSSLKRNRASHSCDVERNQQWLPHVP